MGIINMPLKNISSVLGIAAPVLIVPSLPYYKEREHQHCLHLTYPSPDLIMVGSESTIIWYSFFACLEDIFFRTFTEGDRRCCTSSQFSLMVDPVGDLKIPDPYSIHSLHPKYIEEYT